MSTCGTEFLKDSADAHLICSNSRGVVTASCSLWWNGTPRINGEQVGFIGHYDANDEACGAELLEDALQYLTRKNCAIAVGPVDGSTWRNYRFITGSSDVPLFFLENQNPPHWPVHFLKGGFDVCARYFSAINSDLSRRDPRAEDIRSKLSRDGVSFRTFDMSRKIDELKSILAVSRAAFERNFLYSDISDLEFFAKYTPLLQFLSPELVIMMERRGELVGFCLTVPNYPEGAKPSRAILKTLARIPDRSLAGAGRLMLDLSHKQAEE
ncbi:MAG: hypothetical protein ACRD3W_08985, partial [Terriglobales bacterium]